MKAIDRIRNDLAARGLIKLEGGQGKLTPAGDKYAKDLIRKLKRKRI